MMNPYNSMEQRLNALQAQSQMTMLPYTSPYTAPGIGAGMGMGMGMGINPYGRPSQGITWVNGFEGAKAALIPIDTPVLLMDSTDSKFYIKQINQQGVPVMQTYRFYPEEVATQAPAPVATQAEQSQSQQNQAPLIQQDLILQQISELAQRIENLENKKTPSARKSDVNA